MERKDSSQDDNLSLRDGSRIAVIGAGPAGSFFTYFALQEAKRRGISLEIALYDGKSFGRSGPPGCNMCAGVVATSLWGKLQAMGLTLPPEVIQRRIEGYRLETPTGQITLLPPQESGAIYTVYRGNGPRGSTHGSNVSFDDYLVEQVSQWATIVHEHVKEIRLPQSPGEKVTLVLQSGTQEAVDLVVGAFGVNGALARMVSGLGFGYRPPPTMPSFQAELPWGEANVKQRLENVIYIHVLGLPGVKFTALIPKRAYVTATLIGPEAGPETLAAFLAHPLVARHLPPGWQMPPSYCRCRPRVPVGPCRQPFTDRLVIIGDASDSRLYKNGLESAYVTAQAAATAAVQHGVSRQAWEKHYYPACRRIVQDSWFGRVLFRLNDAVFMSRFLSQRFLTAARREQDRYPAGQRAINEILWSTLTGDRPYRQILGDALHPRIMARVWRLGLFAREEVKE